MTTTTDLEQQLHKARQEEVAAVSREIKRRDDALLAFRAQRLASHDEEALQRDLRAARIAFAAAVDATPVFQAVVDLKAAEWRSYNARMVAVMDQTLIAQAKGTRGPRPYEGSPPTAFTADHLARAINDLVAEKVEADRATLHDAEMAAAATTLTAEQLHQDEVDKETRRRQAELEAAKTPKVDLSDMSATERAQAVEELHQRVKSGTFGSLDVSGLTAKERERIGVPSGSTRFPEHGGWGSSPSNR